jgi:TM2 domain-containing membrane protein YozV
MKKDKTLAYLFWCLGFFGVCGIHRIYIGKIGTGILWLLTLGLFGFGQLFDLFTLGEQVNTINLRKDLNDLGKTITKKYEGDK